MTGGVGRSYEGASSSSCWGLLLCWGASSCWGALLCRESSARPVSGSSVSLAAAAPLWAAALAAAGWCCRRFELRARSPGRFSGGRCCLGLCTLVLAPLWAAWWPLALRPLEAVLPPLVPGAVGGGLAAIDQESVGGGFAAPGLAVSADGGDGLPAEAEELLGGREPGGGA